ncbi:MAG: carbonic anhydrase [Bdellovibrionales bacterium]
MFSKNVLIVILLLSMAVSGCSLKRKRHARNQVEHVMPTAAEQLDERLIPPPTEEVTTHTHATEEVVAVETATPATELPAVKAQASAAEHHTRPASVSAAKATKWLKNGNIRYLKSYFRKDGKTGKDRERLYKGQHPHTIVLSCSDSRVPPELVFDQSLGEVFVIRVAGEALDSSVVASIEYAVEHLGTNNILVMGHTKCGAVDAAMKTPPGKTAGSADLDQLLSDIRPRVARLSRDTASHDLYRESFENAKGVGHDLLKRSAIIRSRVNQGEVKVSSAIYNITTGIVDFE